MVDRTLAELQGRILAMSAEERRAYFDSLDPADRQAMVDYSEHVETAHHQIAFLAPRLFPEIGELATQAELEQVIIGHLAHHHGVTASQYRAMPMFQVADILSADLRGEVSAASESVDVDAAPSDDSPKTKWHLVHTLLDNERDSDSWDGDRRRAQAEKWNAEYEAVVGWERLTTSKLGELIRGRRKKPGDSD